MDDPARVGGIVVAAGSGNRFGGPKHRETVGGRELWEIAVGLLGQAGVEPLVVVGDVPGGVAGGDRRRDSVACGLDELDDGIEFVVVHDAARPLASADLVGRVVDRIRQGDVDCVVPVMPVRDTIKRIDGDAVVETIDRRPLVAVQTPQGFRAASLRFAQQAHDDDAPDDAALIEQWGGSVVTVAGDAANFKITYPSDLAVARAIHGA